MVSLWMQRCIATNHPIFPFLWFLLSQIFAYLAIVVGTFVFWVLFVVFNATQGLLICLACKCVFGLTVVTVATVF